jgi:MFS family permease
MPDNQSVNLLRAKLLLGLGVLMFAIGQSLTFIIVAPLARRVGFDPQSFGIALTLASLPLIFGAPFWGKRSDAVGRKPVFIIGVAGSALGTLLVALVLQVGLNGWVTGLGLLAMFAVARSCYGSVASAIYPAATAYMVDVTDVTNRSQGLAIMGAANGMGSVLGPVLAGALAYFGALVPMYVAVVIGLIGAALSFLFLPEPAKHARAASAVVLKVSDPRLRPFMIMWLVFFLTFIALQLTLAFFLQDEFGITDPKALVRTSSILLISMAAMIVVVQIGVLQVFKLRPQTLLKCLGPLFVIALLIIGLAPGPGGMAIGFAVLGASFACANPGINGSASLCVEPWEQGAAAGFLSAGTTVGAILGPLVGTQLYAHLGHHAVMWVGAIALSGISLFALRIKVPERSWGGEPKTPVATPGIQPPGVTARPD